MDKQSFLEFLKWLETANVDELRSKHAEINKLLETLCIDHVRGDARRMLRFIEEEIMSRLNAPKP